MDDQRTALTGYAVGAAERLGPDTHCSITLRHRESLVSVGSSDERAGRCDQVEVETGDGPCVDATEHLITVLVADVRADDRYPAWREAALDSGFLSSAALPAYVDESTTLALNLYSEDVDPWDPERLLAMDGYIQEIAEAVRTRLGG